MSSAIRRPLAMHWWRLDRRSQLRFKYSGVRVCQCGDWCECIYILLCICEKSICLCSLEGRQWGVRVGSARAVPVLYTRVESGAAGRGPTVSQSPADFTKISSTSRCLLAPRSVTQLSRSVDAAFSGRKSVISNLHISRILHLYFIEALSARAARSAKYRAYIDARLWRGLTVNSVDYWHAVVTRVVARRRVQVARARQ